MHAALLLLSLLFVSLPITPLSAQSGEGVAAEGALFLLLPVGAQGVGLGRAVTALPGQESAFWNPAGLGRIPGKRALLHHGEQIAGEAFGLSLMGNHPEVGTAAVSYQLLDVGDQDFTDEVGQIRGRISVRSHQALVSFAGPVVARFDAGVSFKVIQFRVGCSGECLDAAVTATTYAVDLGLQGMPFPAHPLRVGAMIAHLGPRLQVRNAEQADPLPTRVRIAAAYDLLDRLDRDEPLQLWLAVEAESRTRFMRDPSFYLGAELRAGEEDQLFVRAGYTLGNIDRSDGAAVGAGIRYDRLELAVAKSLIRQSITGETEPIHVTLGILF